MNTPHLLVWFVLVRRCLASNGYITLLVDPKAHMMRREGARRRILEPNPMVLTDTSLLEQSGKDLLEVREGQHSLTTEGLAVEENAVALLVAVSERNGEASQVEQCDFFRVLLPSFLNTTQPNDPFTYRFYLSYDVGDKLYGSVERRRDFENAFLSAVESAGRIELQHPMRDSLVKGSVLTDRSLEGPRGNPIERRLGTLVAMGSQVESGLGIGASSPRASLRWVSVGPYSDGQTGPVRAWNLGYQEAFSDGASFFYQLGEDIELVSPGWAQKLTSQLVAQGNLGLVGGLETKFQKEGKLMPCVMVTRSHMSIFGTFYPTRMHNWWSDDWIMKSYEPFGLATRVDGVEIQNTHAQHRYEVTLEDEGLAEGLEPASHEAIAKYLDTTGRHDIAARFADSSVGPTGMNPL